MDDKVESLHKEEISAIFIDNNELTILSKSGHELYRTTTDIRVETMSRFNSVPKITESGSC
ncbi:hypothetical protein J2S17_000292 [Cytobacillus purgationiresistens]|uniref:YqeB PH domain-containing protein n=2 Tax=Cytobacillus purgationiresistens TaxID=863449 RepID=A0ABU0AAZ6_9BACI|nr:hypothetical protein [Cytobacillus purgationiresistens]